MITPNTVQLYGVILGEPMIDGNSYVYDCPRFHLVIAQVTEASPNAASPIEASKPGGEPWQ